MTGHKIKNIIFDLGNVLVDVDYKRFTDTMGWDHDVFMKFFASDFFREFEVGKHDERTFFNKLNKYIPLQEGDEKRYRHNIHMTFSLRPRTWARVHWLRKRYRVFLFSNTNSLDFNGINSQIDLSRVIRFYYVSHEQGFIKPDPRSYHRMEELFNLDPTETLFVDDRRENIEGALKAGWHAEVIENEEGLFKVFEKYGI
ncbi:MAG: HAD family phosphatase [Candidatus Marinimicrobia bacterium]|nr:HAD family phosphatase [Candidatus Neomarinimicrobiota bacterium]